jgi:hypothetical protein
MALTDNCDIFGSLDEEGINRFIQHVMRQRPSLFNFGTALLLNKPELLCEAIEAIPDVNKRGNPLITVEDPLPIIGSSGEWGINFCFQLTKAEIDFHPGGVFNLPSELSPPLGTQRFAFHVKVCGGIGCPPDDLLRRFETSLAKPFENDFNETANQIRERKLRLPPKPIPTDKLDCFCLELFAIGHIEMTGSPGNQRITPKLDNLEVVDIKPKGLEDSAECYLKLLIHLVLLPRLSISLEKLSFGILDGLATIRLFATPISSAVPNNPAIEQNKIKTFVNMEVL